MRRVARLCVWFSAAVAGCGSDDASSPDLLDAAVVDQGRDLARPTRTLELDRLVTVTLDGKPLGGIVVSQGGNPERWTTAADGTVMVHLDPAIPGDRWVLASHPEARIGGALVTPSGPLTVELTRFDPGDNELYQFQNPGTPMLNGDTSYCAHCHVTLDADWYASPHRRAASNPTVHDLYAGTAAALSDEVSCTAAGGRWRTGIGPGTAKPASRCYLGAGTLPDLNPGCDQAAPCDGKVAARGACADCHAPGIDGQLGGRDLLEATGIAYDYGVHCDVCHAVESVDLGKPAGVAGRLAIKRAAELSPSPTLGRWLPLTFGPLDDVPNPRMGAVAREHFHQALFCAGCHQHDQEALVPGATVDRKRWPDGRLPIHGTFAEWSAGPFAPDTPCQSCHMPSDGRVLNSSDLQLFPAAVGAAGGWMRPVGTTRRHVWAGPRQPEFQMLRNAASLVVDKHVDNGVLTVTARVRNVGAGHAIPTGEPLRSLVLRVEAKCGAQALSAVGGDAIPDFGGALAEKRAGDDWSVWPGAKAGQVVRVVARPGGDRDYRGPGPFGDGRFAAADKGMPVEEVVGEATVMRVDNGDKVTFDKPLPMGARALLGDAGGPGGDGAPSLAVAGAPGFAFAKVLVDGAGRRGAPHHRAVDVVSDNRLMPGASSTTTHRFASSCPDPTVHATLVHRAYPVELARQRRWTLTDSMMVEVTR